MTAGATNARLRPAVLLAFSCSGAAGVMHEVLWSRQLARLAGAEAYAQAISLAVFMLGLALGAWLARRFADGPRALSRYVMLELAIAGYGLCVPLLLWAAGLGYLPLARLLFEQPAARLALRLLLTALVVLPPAAMMGATLPLLAGRLIRAADGPAGVRRQVGALYAANTVGAVLGTAAAGFVVLPLLGQWGALAVAVLANLIAAAVLLPAARGERTAPPEGPAAQEPPEPAADAVPMSARLRAAVLAALFISGLCAMGYEVLFVRVVSLAAGASAYAFSVMLLCFITGIALGSALAARLRLRSSANLLALAQLLVVAGFVATTPLLARLPYLLALARVRLQGVSLGFALHLVLLALLCLAITLPATVALGLTFPVVADLNAARSPRAGARIGTAYAVNTAGNVLGVLLVALLLLPRLGLDRSFHLLWAANLAAALALLVLAGRRPSRPAVLVLLLAAGGLGAYLVAGTGWSRTLTLVPDHFMLRTGPDPRLAPAHKARHPTASFAGWKRRYLLSEQGDRFTQVYLLHDAHNTVLAFGPDRARNGSITLAVNNKSDASTADDLETQLLLGHVPMFLARDPKQVLVIGHGVGITAGATVRYMPDRVDLVEISPAVLRLDPLFANDNDYVLSDNRVRVYNDDGLGFLRATPRRYDVIISEPSNPWIAGVGDLFTVEFLRLARDRLTPDGLFTFWFHTYAQSDDTTRLLLRTLGTVFPHVELFADMQLGNIVAVAFPGKPDLDFDRLERRFREPAVARDLERIGLPNLVAFLGLHVTSQSGPHSLAGPGPVNTLARERLRYAGPRALFWGVDSFFLEARTPMLRDPALPPQAGAPPSLLDRYENYRAAKGDPLRAAELVIAADWAEDRAGYGPAAGRFLRARAEKLEKPSTP